jgi:lipoprotein-anchoring transpeptidase ErfK/SrfK
VFDWTISRQPKFKSLPLLLSLTASIVSVYAVLTGTTQAKPTPQHQVSTADAPAHAVRPKQVASKAYPVSPLLQPEHHTGNSVLVILHDRKMLVYRSDGKILRQYAVYIGTKSHPTPTGQFRVMENVKPENDEWYLGPRWIGFAMGYDRAQELYAGFHGWVYTRNDDENEKTDPGWKTSTDGCVQLTNSDLQDFAALVGVGDRVTIVDRPVADPRDLQRSAILSSLPELIPQMQFGS